MFSVCCNVRGILMHLDEIIFGYKERGLESFKNYTVFSPYNYCNS